MTKLAPDTGRPGMAAHDSSSEKEIFHAAYSLTDEAARSDYLNVACGNDGALRSRIESLLKAAEDGGAFMRNRAVDSIVADIEQGDTASHLLDTPLNGSRDAGNGSAACLFAGQTLGHYRVITRIGAGGMGEVYLAEDARLGRNVALKVIAPGRIGEGRTRSIREAQAASALDHPNVCTIHDVGEDGGWCFIAMQYVEGISLAEMIGGQPLPLDTLLSIALQVADGLNAAHERGVIHCDIKPRNIIINPRGRAKILDFGLAKLLAPLTSETTRPEGVAGTPAYMAPEQVRGETVDHRSDVFSFGAVIYEMATGRAPFRGEMTADLLHAVIAEPHTPVREVNPEIPAGLAAVMDRAMAKSPEARYQSIEELASELRAVQAKLSLLARREPTSRRWRRWLTAAALASCVALALGWPALRSINRSWAKRQLPAIDSLIEAGRTLEAQDLVRRVRQILPDEPKLTRLVRATSDILSVRSDPPGARVYLKRFEGSLGGGASTRALVGITPMEHEVARGDYIVSVEKQGFAPRQRTWSTGVVLDTTSPATFESLPVDVRLTRERDLPPGMVFVPGGKYRLQSWSRRLTETTVNLDGYFIDQCEVTNRQYKEFVDAHGYLEERFWRVPFEEEARTLSQAEAMSRLIDLSGKPGPRGWSNQMYPDGKANHPVTGITWYEAAAYAVFREKSLPTIFQWERASRDGEQLQYRQVYSNFPWGPLVGPTDGRANFYSSGTVPVGSLEFGMSPFGCYEMAGNVAEWCLNPTPKGYLVCGGSFESVAYEFGYYGSRPGFDASEKLGFRCVKNSSGTSDQGAMPLNLDAEAPQYTPQPEEQVRAHFERYQYVKTPLNERVVDVVEVDHWWREQVEYVGADSKPRRAYLYRPKHFPEPHQVIHFVPAGDVFYRNRSLTQSIEADYAGFVCSGRALFAVMQDEFLGGAGPLVWERPALDTPEYVDYLARRFIDMRRGLDYLETRNGLDTSRIAFFEPSAGGFPMAYLAVEDRYKAVVLQGAGIRKPGLNMHQAANPIDFAPLIVAPKLLVHGIHDEAILFKTEAEPLFNLLQHPKDMIAYKGGHRPDPEALASYVNPWLDEKLGPVVGTVEDVGRDH